MGNLIKKLIKLTMAKQHWAKNNNYPTKGNKKTNKISMMRKIGDPKKKAAREKKAALFEEKYADTNGNH